MPVIVIIVLALIGNLMIACGDHYAIDKVRAENCDCERTNRGSVMNFIARHTGGADYDVVCTGRIRNISKTKLDGKYGIYFTLHNSRGEEIETFESSYEPKGVFSKDQTRYIKTPAYEDPDPKSRFGKVSCRAFRRW